MVVLSDYVPLGTNCDYLVKTNYNTGRLTDVRPW